MRLRTRGTTEVRRRCPPPPPTVRALQESNHISSVDIFHKLLACVDPGHLVYVAGETLGGAG